MVNERITGVLRLTMILFVALSFISFSYVTGCTDPAPTETAGDSGNPDQGGSCTSNTDCDTGYFCNSGKCEKACSSDSDCTGGKTCQNSQCVASTEGCASDAECPPGKICKDKECVEDTAGQEPAKVEIVTKGGVLREGQTKTFQARVLNKSGATINGDFSFEWSSNNTDSVTIDAKGVATGGSKDGESNITVKLKELTSDAVKVVNYANIADGKARVIVVDDNQAPVANATIKIGDKSGTTDANGVAVIDGATPPFDVHVFHKEYNYFSAFGISKTDLYVQVNKSVATDQAGGVKGNFNFKQLRKLFGIDEVTWEDYTVGFGIAGAALDQNLLNLNFDLLIGESFNVNIFSKDVSLPSGVVVALAGGSGKPEYQTLSKAGRQLIWGFGGKFKVDDVLPIVTAATGGGDLNIGSILAQAKPLFANMAFGYLPDVTVQLFPRVADKDDKNGDGKKDDLIPDFDKFPQHDVVLAAKLDKSIPVTISKFPSVKHNGKDVELLSIGLAGVLVPGVGIVPLGLDVDQVKSGSGNLTIKYAEPSGILKTGKFAAITLTLNIPSGDDAPPLMIFGEVKLGDSAPSSMTIASFLDVAQNAKYDPTSRKLESANVDGASATQVDINDGNGKKWLVFFGASANGTVTLPEPPSGFDDRATNAKDVSVRPVKLTDGQTIDSLLEFNSTNMDSLVNYIGAFSSITVFEKK
jgi:hypothetical protein